jgi:6,7-dimethyl-8-ribityllumazine synthase
MANILPSRPRQMGPRRSIAIVSSTYHEAYARGLLDHTLAEIEAIAPGTEVRVVEVPGAFEVPIAVQALAESGDADAVIALGLLMEGETAHARLISQAVTDGLMRIALTTRVPIVHEVLVVTSEAQARARCIEDELNRGTEAARVAMHMAKVMGGFPRRSPR